MKSRAYTAALLLLLWAAAPLSLFANEVRAPFAENCEGIYGNISARHRWQPGWSKEDPTFHSFNSDAELTKIMNFPKRLPVQRWEFSDGLEMVCIKGASCYYFTKAEPIPGSPKMFVLHLKDIQGNAHAVTAREDNLENFIRHEGKYRLHNQYFVEPGGWQRLPQKPAENLASLPELKAKFQEEKLANLNAEQLGDYLSQRQLATSRNASQATDTVFANSILEANLLLAQLLKEGKELDIEVIEKLNWHANQGVHLYGDATLDAAAGVIRGTENRAAVINGQGVLVDMTGSQVYQMRWDFIMTHFIPASKASAATEALVSKINRITPQSDPREIFALFQEFIRIHPFLDGNGRTGRMLLNYMLLKAELPTMSKPSKSLFFSADELYANYLTDVLEK